MAIPAKHRARRMPTPQVILWLSELKTAQTTISDKPVMTNESLAVTCLKSPICLDRALVGGFLTVPQRDD